MDTWSADAFAGYLAGFLDGEGCIEINKDECGIRIRLANTERDVLDGIAARLGFGRVEQYRRPKPHWQQLYCYAVSSAPDVERLLLTVRPLLIIKASKADAALRIITRQRARMEAVDARNRMVLAALQTGELQKSIAKRFGISQTYVSKIKKGHTWPCEIARFNARRGLKKGIRPSDAIFRLHGVPSESAF